MFSENAFSVIFAIKYTQKLRQDKCWNAQRRYQSSYSINKHIQCQSQHMFSASAASPGRANSLLQKYFLQTRIPWGEMGARSSCWAHESTPIHRSQCRQACWHVWLTLALTHCFVSSETTPERDFQACPWSWSHQFCLLPCGVRNFCCLQRKLIVYWRTLQLCSSKRYQWTSLGIERQSFPY